MQAPSANFSQEKRLELLVNNLSVPQHRSGQQQGVDAVQDAAVAGQQNAGSLTPTERLSADSARSPTCAATLTSTASTSQYQRSSGIGEPGRVPLRQQCGQTQQAAGGQQTARHRTQRALPGLVGAERGRQLVPSPGAANIKRRDIPAQTTQSRNATSEGPLASSRRVGTAIRVSPHRAGRRWRPPHPPSPARRASGRCSRPAGPGRECRRWPRSGRAIQSCPQTAAPEATSTATRGGFAPLRSARPRYSQPASAATPATTSVNSHSTSARERPGPGPGNQDEGGKYAFHSGLRIHRRGGGMGYGRS